MSNNNLRKHKQGNAVKWILTGIACLIVAVFIVGLCLQVFAQSENLKPSNWFKKDEETEQLPEDDEGKENVGDSAFVQGTEERGIRLTSTSVEREVSSGYQSSFHLEATVLPEDADNKNIKWTLTWKNPESSWANGKDVYEYMSVSSSESEGEFAWNTYGAFHSVDVTPIKAYGEEIVVTVTSEDNEEAFASKTFGYIKRVKKANVALIRPGEQGMATDTLTFGDGKTYVFQCMPEFTDGTATPTVTFGNYTSFLEGSFVMGTTLATKLGGSRSWQSIVSSADVWKDYWKAGTTLADLKEYVAKSEQSGLTDCLRVRVTATITGSSKLPNIYEKTKYFTASFKIDIAPLIVNVNNVTVNDPDSTFHF